MVWDLARVLRRCPRGSVTMGRTLVVLCHGNHCYASLRKHGAGGEQRSTASSAECELPKGSSTFTDHSSKLPFLTQNTNSVANRSLERIN